MPVFQKTELTPKNILAHIENTYREKNDKTVFDLRLIFRVLSDMIDLFNGKRRGYHTCDTKYHNLFHTLQTVPPFVEIIGGWNKSGAKPRIGFHTFELGIVGVLLHDTGYIRRKGDDGGSGAKYTLTHVQRSIEFADTYLDELGISPSDKKCIMTIIQCTGVTLDMNIPFRSDEEKIIGYALGTADLLGQMSASDYLDMLPILYNEFAESYAFSSPENKPGGAPPFASAEDLIRSTPSFYENVALGRFTLMGSMERYIAYCYDGHSNPYMAAIETNIDRIRKRWK